jgi:hypothetical protein
MNFQRSYTMHLLFKNCYHRQVPGTFLFLTDIPSVDTKHPGKTSGFAMRPLGHGGRRESRNSGEVLAGEGRGMGGVGSRAHLRPICGWSLGRGCADVIRR